MWASPLCSAKIQAVRTDELVRLVDAAHAEGFQVAMVTLTMRHKAGARLQPMWKALSDALKPALGTDRAVRNVKEALGVIGWVRRVEVTHGRHGWHVHVHVLIFYRRGDPWALEAPMWRGWIRGLARHGLDADPRWGIDVRPIVVGQAREGVARYLGKSTFEYTSGSAARELGGQVGKDGRRGNRTPFDILADAVDHNRPQDVALWWEWEQTSKGKRALTWSTGKDQDLRKRFSLGDERTDEAIAEDTGSAPDVAMLDDGLHDAIACRRLEEGLFEAIEDAVPTVEEGYEAVAAFCCAHGLPSPGRTPRLLLKLLDGVADWFVEEMGAVLLE